MEGCGRDSPGLGYGSVMGCFEHSHKSMDSMKTENVINNLREY